MKSAAKPTPTAATAIRWDPPQLTQHGDHALLPVFTTSVQYFLRYLAGKPVFGYRPESCSTLIISSVTGSNVIKFVHSIDKSLPFNILKPELRSSKSVL